MSDTFPKDALFKVTLLVAIPREATQEDVEEWLRSQILGDHLARTNELHGEPLEAFGPSGFDFEPTGYRGLVQEYDVEQLPGGGRRCKVSYLQEII